MSERDHDIFTKRGITPHWEGGAVARAQGFARYEGRSWEERRNVIAAIEELYGGERHPDTGKAGQLWRRAIERADRRFGPDQVTDYLEENWTPVPVAAYLNGTRARLPRETRRAWTYWLRKALAVDGWIMPRHAILPDSERREFRERPVAQLRPDAPVVMGAGWEWHHHSYDLRPDERDAHEAKLCEWSSVPRGRVLDQRTKDGRPEYLIPTGHLHPDTGELVVPLAGRHGHWEHAKYLYTPGDTARRLGTNPLALERGWGARDELFVVVLEGTLKMCSVVEAGYPAIDAGSVTLWHGGVEEADWADDSDEPMGLYVRTELEEFAARHLEGRPVAVVCDSDWHSNPLVLEQTEKVATILRGAGARAVACAPPAGESRGWRHPLTGLEMKAKRGVDDWLGEQEPGDRHDAMLELVYQERIGDADLTINHPVLAGIRSDGRQTVVDLVTSVGELASPETRVAPYPEGRLMQALGRPKEPLQRAKRTAIDRGILEEITKPERIRHGGGYFMTPGKVRLVPDAMPKYRMGTLREWLQTLK